MGRLLNINNAGGNNFSYTYDANGNKLSENDFNGNSTFYTYDTTNRLQTKTEALDKTTDYTYDNVGNVLTQTTADRIATYTYDPSRYFLTSFTGDGAAQSTNKAASDATTIRSVDGEGNILSETDPNGNTTTFSYDAFNRVISESGPMGSGRQIQYDANGNILSETTLNDSANQLRSFSYDGANRRKTITDATGGLTRLTYDPNGNVTIENRPQNKTTVFAYNNLNLVSSKTQNSNPHATWAFGYDKAGNLTTETLPNGNIITTEYDVLNRPVSKTDSIGAISSFSYDNNSNISTQTDGKGNTSTHSYNALNQRTSSNQPLNRSHSFGYSLFGELTSDTGPNGTINYSINTLGQRQSATGPNNYHELYDYDSNDNLTSFTDSRGTLTTYNINALNQTDTQITGIYNKAFNFDILGNKRSETDYRGIDSTFEYDRENRQLTFNRAGKLQNTTIYNDAGLAQSETDANGNSRVHLYDNQYFRTQTNLPETQLIKYTPDAFGDVTAQDNPGANDITRVFDKRRRLTSETNGAGEQTQYEYDLNNNRTAVIKPDGTRWEYSYDEANRLRSISNTIEGITTGYDYDNKDNLISVTDAMNKQTQFDFDNRNRKLAKHYPDGKTVDYSYDENGNLATVDLPNGTAIIYQYDILNRKTNEDYTSPYGTGSVVYTLDNNGNTTQIVEILNGQTFTTSQSFDDLDRLSSRTDVNNSTYNYVYDANGNRTKFIDHANAITNYTFDGLNRLKKLTHAGIGTFDWRYNIAGLVEKIAYPNAASINYLYDDANRISSIRNKKSNTIITSHFYQYDLNGNRTRLSESNINVDQEINYQYDKADRLTRVIYPSQTTQYVLDKVGNRTSEILSGTVNNTKTYSYNNRDQLTTITDPNGLNIVYSYDDAGNQLSKDENGIITTFDYTARHRVKTITVGGAPPINYLYDYTGQRVKYLSKGLEKRYHYDGLTLIAQTNVLGNTFARYHYGDRFQLAETRSRINSYFHVDSLGTNVAVSNTDGSIAARYEYDAFGNLLTEAGSSDQPFGFTGYQKDDETGLYYANARYYDSNTGRFLREDPFDGDTQTPPSLHRYLYANVNPNFYVDPTGKCNEAFDGFSFAGCIDEAEDLRSVENPRTEIMKRIEIENASYAGIAQVGVDAVKGTFELANQLSGTLGEGLSGGYYYRGSSREFRNTLHALGNGIAHPLDSIEQASLAHHAKVLAFQEAGNHTAAAKEKSRFQATWFIGIFSVAKTIQSIAKNSPKMVVESPDNKLNLADVDVLSIRDAKRLEGDNVGLIFVKEPQGNLNKFFEQFDAGTPGAFSETLTNKRAVPALRFDNPNPRGHNFVKFDGIEIDTNTIIDRKMSLTTRPKQLNSLQRASAALEHNPNFNGVFEFPTQKAANTAIDILFDNGIFNIEVRVVKSE